MTAIEARLGFAAAEPELETTLMSKLEIRDLHVAVERHPDPARASTSPSSSGETHAIMGPNGSGKSTLAYSIAGHPKYTVTSGRCCSTAPTCSR